MVPQADEQRYEFTVIVWSPGDDGTGTMTELNALGAQGWSAVGLAPRAARLRLQHGDLLASFRAIVGSDEIAAVKPAPDGIHYACRLLDANPAKTAYVGDAIYDLRCARAAGHPDRRSMGTSLRARHRATPRRGKP